MKIVKTCAYRAMNYNLLPAILLVPLRAVPPQPSPSWLRKPLANRITGFRLALKFLCWHAGIEVHLHNFDPI